MSSPQIFLLSAPSASGKSTALKHFVYEQRKAGKKVAGILQIVKNDYRYLHFLSSNQMKQLQLNDIGAHPKHQCHSGSHSHSDDQSMNKEDAIKVGPFLFSKAVLNDSHIEMKEARDCDWMIIDEIGPLELKRKQGYEPAISHVLERRKSQQFRNTKFIIVVRPSLKEQIATAFGLDASEIGDFEDIFPWKQLSIPTQYARPFIMGTLCALIVFIIGRHNYQRNEF